MKKVLSIVVLVAVLACGQAQATVLLQTGFEGNSSVSTVTNAAQETNPALRTASVPDGWDLFQSTGTWVGPVDTIIGTPMMSVQVATQSVYAGDNALRIKRYTHATTRGNLSERPSGKAVHFEFMYMLPSSTPKLGWASQIYLGDTAGQINNGFGAQGAEGNAGSAVMIMIDTGQTTLGDAAIAVCVNGLRLGGEGYTGFIGLMAKKDTWQKYEIDLNQDTKTWTLKVDGVAANQSFGYNKPEVTSLNAVTFRGAQGGNEYFVDNVLVTPEPVTLALLGLGGLFLRRKS